MGTISDILGIASFIGMIIQYCYYHKIRFYVWVVRMFKRSSEASFDISMTYKVKKDDNAVFKKIEKILKQKYGEQCYKKEMNMDKHKIYSLKQMLLNIQLDDTINADAESNELFIKIPNVRITYKSTENFLEDIEAIVQEFEKSLSVAQGSYSMNINYLNGKNPFFGMAIERIGKESVKSFKCQMECRSIIDKGDTVGDKTATVYKEYVNITDDSFNTIRRLGQYLLLLR